ncbi:MAG: AarF/ABC1/UbiB kinase family protein [Phyllobacterium sp.]|jgi:ubiquinone biosynthesis protein|nr:AarF/ABC1/UbiB kinase family protein [Phyllobacterium sp.]
MPIFRLFRITLEVLRFMWDGAVGRLGLSRSVPQAPERLRLSLERLGTTFIKLGQALSMRRDVLPDAYIEALQALQDHVAPFPAKEAIEEIERGLSRHVNELFAEFDATPLAAASIAQVHTARLHDGRDVIVKVRRAGIKQKIDRDMRALTWLTRIALMLAPRLRHYQPLRVIDEIWSNLYKEIDFRREAQNIKRFAVAFAEWPTLLVPDVVDDLVCETAIVQERSGGLRIDDPAVKSIGPRLAQNFVDAYLHQIFVLGVFHGDPHPGNLFVTQDKRICFHDFGLIGFLDRAARRKLAAFTIAFIRQDADWLLDAAIDLGVLGGEMDRGEFRRGLAEIIADYAALPLKDWSLAEAFLRVTRLGRAQNVFVPLDLLILMRAMFLAEHTVRILDPDFQLLENLQAKGPEALKGAMEQSDWTGALDRLKIDAITAAHDLPAVIRSWTRQLVQEGDGLGLSLHVRELKGLNEHIDRGSNRLALGLVTLGLYIAGSLLMQHSIGPRIFGDMPALAAFAYILALWFTFRLVRGIARSGKL